MNQKRKGFTLIELLAVIVILAIIALIAVPVIMNIINKANKSAFKDTAYGIISAGELFFAEQQLEPNGMLEDVTITLPDSRLELKGDIPEGSVTITKDGKVSIAVNNGRYCVTKGLDDTDVTITEDLANCTMPSGGNNEGAGKTLSEIVTTGYMQPSTSTSTSTSVPAEFVDVPSCVTKGQTCSIGTPMVIKVNDATTQNFYVIKDDGETVTLLMDRNLGDNVDWYADDCDNSHGPVTAVAALKSRTDGWENIAEKEYTYSDDGGGNKYTAFTETMRARLITYTETNSVKTSSGGTIPIWMLVNLDGYDVDGYWMSAAGEYDGTASNIDCSIDYLDYIGSSTTMSSRSGVRPVIEVSK